METTSKQPVQSRLTEQNLQLHTKSLQSNTQTYSTEADQTWEPYYQFEDIDYDESDDEDLDTRMNKIELRRAASLEALKIYGGCFASGFLAMQQSPRPTTTTPQRQQYYLDVETLELRELASQLTSIESGSIESGSTSSYSSVGRPRADSVTLSPVGFQEGRCEKKWSWRNIGRRRRNRSNKSQM